MVIGIKTLFSARLKSILNILTPSHSGLAAFVFRFVEWMFIWFADDFDLTGNNNSNKKWIREKKKTGRNNQKTDKLMISQVIHVFLLFFTTWQNESVHKHQLTTFFWLGSIITYKWPVNTLYKKIILLFGIVSARARAASLNKPSTYTREILCHKV